MTAAGLADIVVRRLWVGGQFVPLVRAYSSIEQATTASFGAGWRWLPRDVQLETNVPATGHEAQGVYRPFGDGTRLMLTTPSGQRLAFQFTPQRREVPGQVYGADRVSNWGNASVVFGGAGNDIIDSRRGENLIAFGGDGDDTIHGGTLGGALIFGDRLKVSKSLSTVDFADWIRGSQEDEKTGASSPAETAGRSLRFLGEGPYIENLAESRSESRVSIVRETSERNGAEPPVPDRPDLAAIPAAAPCRSRVTGQLFLERW